VAEQLWRLLDDPMPKTDVDADAAAWAYILESKLDDIDLAIVKKLARGIAGVKRQSQGFLTGQLDVPCESKNGRTA